MDYEQIIGGIANYGFPICITWYLLVRTESKLDKLSSNIEGLSNTLNSFLN